MGACNDRLLQNVYETGFALDEATLYLDTHPKCPMAMQYFQNARRMNEQAIRAFEQDYTIVNRKTDGNIITIRLLSDHKPCAQAIEKEPNLDDVYLSYFREENAYVETDLL